MKVSAHVSTSVIYIIFLLTANVAYAQASDDSLYMDDHQSKYQVDYEPDILKYGNSVSRIATGNPFARSAEFSAGTYVCNKDTFHGDPYPNIYKACYYKGIRISGADGAGGNNRFICDAGQCRAADGFDPAP